MVSAKIMRIGGGAEQYQRILPFGQGDPARHRVEPTSGAANPPVSRCERRRTGSCLILHLSDDIRYPALLVGELLRKAECDIADAAVGSARGPAAKTADADIGRTRHERHYEIELRGPWQTGTESGATRDRVDSAA